MVLCWSLLALVAALAVSGGEPFKVRQLQREAASLCEEASVTPVSCSDASEDGLLAHPDDCRLFYKCPRGDAAAVCVPCPPGLHYNPELRVCDRPEHAGCDPSLLSTPTPESGPAGNDIPQRCIDNSVTPVSCASVPAPDALVPHPDDCELFYYCVSASAAPVCRRCPAGLHFNPNKRVCDNSADAGCTVGLTTSPPAV